MAARARGWGHSKRRVTGTSGLLGTLASSQDSSLCYRLGLLGARGDAQGRRRWARPARPCRIPECRPSASVRVRACVRTCVRACVCACASYCLLRVSEERRAGQRRVRQPEADAARGKPGFWPGLPGGLPWGRGERAGAQPEVHPRGNPSIPHSRVLENQNMKTTDAQHPRAPHTPSLGSGRAFGRQ